MSKRNVVPSDGRRARTRRQVLTTLGAAGALGLAGCSGGDGGDGGDRGSGDSSDDGGSTGGDGPDPVTVGVSIPTTGGALPEGEELKAGYDLAVRHLNEGAGLASGATVQEGLGGGILDRPVERVVQNSKSTASGAKASATTLVTDEGADVLVGGGSSVEALAQASVADAESTVYMAGFAPTPDLGGSACSTYAFNEMCNTKLIGQALAPALRSQFGTDNLFGQLYPNTDLGKSLFADVQEPLEETIDWRQIGAESARVGTTEFRNPLERLIELGPDVIVLNFTGIDGADALREAREVIPEDIGIVAPLFNRPMARNTGDPLKDIIGTVHWDAAIDNGVGEAFVEAWDGDGRPSGLAHLAYTQLFQYAAAAERAGSTEADAVVSALEGHQYDHGTGQATLRACDHQSMRPVPVVKGLPGSAQADGKYFRMFEVNGDVGYDCETKPASDCTF
jgi:ABC-type branched-subunit amino acid transport system substrate-binding protein